MAEQIYVNLPVKDLEKTKAFFTQLGFSFDPKITDEKAAGLIIGENIYAMLLSEQFFKDFIPGKEIADAAKSTEVLVAISAESREAVDTMIENAIDAGGQEYRKAEDHGWMYARAFEDPDGHIWEVLHSDESKMPEEMKNRA